MTKTTVDHCIFLGSPGVGKSTYAYKLAHERGMVYLSVSQMLRASVDKGTHTGKHVKRKIEMSQIVPDDLVFNAMRETIQSGICRNGFILDGFPKNVSQAQALDTMLSEQNMSLDRVYYFSVVNDNIIIDRLSKSFIHPASGRIYNLNTNPPKREGKDDATGESLIPRPEDSEKNVRKRLHTYRLFSGDLVKYYRDKGILYAVDAAESIDVICARLSSELPERESWFKSTALASLAAITRAAVSTSYMPGLNLMKRALSLLTFGIVKL